MATRREIGLEAEEWYVVCNWLRSRENRLMYALRPRSREWERTFEVRQSIEDQLGDARETDGIVQTVALSESEVARLVAFLRRRSWLLLLWPWRDRERRDVIRVRRHLLDQLESRPDDRPRAEIDGRHGRSR